MHVCFASIMVMIKFSGCVRKVLSVRSVQNGVEQAERSESLVGSIWSFCSFPNVCCQWWWSFKLLQTFLEIRTASSATFVNINRNKNRPDSVRRSIKITNRTNAFPNAMDAIRPNSAHIPTIYRTRFSTVWPIGSNRSSFPNTPIVLMVCWYIASIPYCSKCIQHFLQAVQFS